MFFLEGLPAPPAGTSQAVWEVGRLAGKLHAWCRKLHRRAQREVAWPEELDFEEPRRDAEGFLDAVAAAEVLLTPEEQVCVYFRFMGYTSSQAQEILGISRDAYRQRVHRLQRRLTDE